MATIKGIKSKLLRSHDPRPRLTDGIVLCDEETQKLLLAETPSHSIQCIVSERWGVLNLVVELQCHFGIFKRDWIVASGWTTTNNSKQVAGLSFCFGVPVEKIFHFGNIEVNIRDWKSKFQNESKCCCPNY